MPKFEIKLTLENAARKSGGDKYEGLFIHESGATASIQPYVPQLISRPDGGKPVPVMNLTLEY